MAITAKEQPLVEKAFDILKENKQPKSFYELAAKVEKSDFSAEERAEFLTRLYTIMSVDGRFLSIGSNFWGLKSWYPVDQQEEEVAIKIEPSKADIDDFEDLEDNFDGEQDSQDDED